MISAGVKRAALYVPRPKTVIPACDRSLRFCHQDTKIVIAEALRAPRPYQNCAVLPKLITNTLVAFGLPLGVPTRFTRQDKSLGWGLCDRKTPKHGDVSGQVPL